MAVFTSVPPLGMYFRPRTPLSSLVFSKASARKRDGAVLRVTFPRRPEETTWTQCLAEARCLPLAQPRGTYLSPISSYWSSQLRSAFLRTQITRLDIAGVWWCGAAPSHRRKPRLTNDQQLQREQCILCICSLMRA